MLGEPAVIYKTDKGAAAGLPRQTNAVQAFLLAEPLVAESVRG
jgi:hypothetical protein